MPASIYQHKSKIRRNKRAQIEDIEMKANLNTRPGWRIVIDRRRSTNEFRVFHVIGIRPIRGRVNIIGPFGSILRFNQIERIGSRGCRRANRNNYMNMVVQRFFSGVINLSECRSQRIGV